MNAKHLFALATLAFVAACSNTEAATAPEQETDLEPPEAAEGRFWRRANGPEFEVSGTGIHYFTTAIIHSQTPTDVGMVQRSSDVVELRGDIEGYVLYHPTSVFDYQAGTLTNTGKQVFSGSIMGSDPVILYDDDYRVQVTFGQGTVGKVFLRRSRDQRRRDGWYECDLTLIGEGEETPAGDAVVSWNGTCQKFGR